MSMPRERKMAVRPIDGEALLGIERLLDTDVVRESKTASWLLDQVLHDIQAMPTLTPPNESERAGLYGKYTVYKNKDGSLVTDCFILRPEKDPAAVAALRAYAAATDNAELAADIINWVGAEPNEPLTCGLVDRLGMPLRAGDTVAADKFFVYAVRYGSHNVNPDNCAPAYQVGWYLEIMWAYPGFEDSVGHTEPLYDIDGTAARYPAHCADTADGLYNLKLEVCCRPPEGEEDNHG